VADAPLDAFGDQKPQAQQAVNAALADARSMLGKNEVPNHAELQSYLRDGGQDLDPHKLAWCAAFVSASLNKAGLPVPTQVVKGSEFGPGAYAPNYLTYGSAVDPKSIQAGDVLVANNGTHVGFAEGPMRQGPNGPEVQLLAGNERDPSGQYAPGSYTNPETGATANRAQVGMVGERWVPLSQYSARRYEPTDGQGAAPPQGTTINSTSRGAASLSPTDRDWIIRTVAGEADPNAAGQTAVANVIRNRLESGKWGNTGQAVVLAPGQFSMWNDKTGYAGGAGANKGGNLSPDSSQYQNIGSIVDNVFSGQTPDPTKGALNYYAPGGMKDGKAPAWAAEMTNPITIGAQVYGTAPSTGPARPVTPTPSTAYPTPPGTTINSTPVASGAPALPGMGPGQTSQLTQGMSGFQKAMAGGESQDGGGGEDQIRPSPMLQGPAPHIPNPQAAAQTFGQTLNSMRTPLQWGSGTPGSSISATAGPQVAPGVPQGMTAQELQQLQMMQMMGGMGTSLNSFGGGYG
jgi:spore germination cell wall hydrolase CwlJ-like protein